MIGLDTEYSNTPKDYKLYEIFNRRIKLRLKGKLFLGYLLFIRS